MTVKIDVVELARDLSEPRRDPGEMLEQAFTFSGQGGERDINESAWTITALGCPMASHT